MIRFGIIGCGGITPWHIRAINDLPNGVLTAVCDANPDAALRWGEENGVPAFTEPSALFSSGTVDAVAICTPSGLHAPIAEEALRAGISAIVEKPMAITPETLDRLLSAAEQSPAMLCPISQLRFCPDIARAKKLIENGKLGQIRMADLSMKYWRDDEYYKEKPWRGTLTFDGGGALMNQGIHGVDLLRYLCGETEVVGAYADTLVHPIETEDTLAASLRFGNGSLGVLTASTATYPGFPRRIEICGDKGFLTLEEGTLVACSDPSVEVSLPGDAGGHREAFAIAYEPHRLQYKNVANALEGKEPLLVTAADAAGTLRMIFEIYRVCARTKEKTI